MVDIAAKSVKSGLLLNLRADIPAVLTVQPSDRGGQSIVGQGTGMAYLSAVDTSETEIDRLSVKVVEVAQLAFNTASMGFGTFALRPVGDIDGTFDLKRRRDRLHPAVPAGRWGGQPLLGATALPLS